MYNRYCPYLYNRSEIDFKPSTPISKHPPHSPTKPPKKKYDFKSLKKDTCTSLNDVECFLNKFTHTLKYIKLINLLK